MKPIHIVLDLQTGCNLPLLPKQWWIPIHKNLHPTETRPPRSLNDQYKSGTCISICLLLDLKHFLPFISTFSAVILRATIWNVQQGAKCAALPCFSFYFGSIWKSFFRSFQTKYIKDSSIIINDDDNNNKYKTFYQLWSFEHQIQLKTMSKLTVRKENYHSSGKIKPTQTDVVHDEKF